VVDGPATIATSDPLAIAPDENRLDQSLMLERARDAAGRRRTCLGVADRRHAEHGRKQQGKDQPNQ
jgi:hypothetical protein